MIRSPSFPLPQRFAVGDVQRELDAGAPRGLAAGVLLSLWGCVGLVFVLLAAAAGSSTTAPDDLPLSVVSSTVVPPAVEVASADSRREILRRATQLRHDGRSGRSEREQATLESETKDEDAQPDMSAAAPPDRLVWRAQGRRMTLGAASAVEASPPLVSTGLARGPPVAG